MSSNDNIKDSVDGAVDITAAEDNMNADNNLDQATMTTLDEGDELTVLDSDLDSIAASTEAMPADTDDNELAAAIDTPPLAELLAAAIFSSTEPCSVARLQQLFPRANRPTAANISDQLQQLKDNWQGLGVELVEVATGWRFQISSRFAPWLQRYQAKKPAKYTRATLETLALIIYKQPITRGEIEQVRGVAVSTHMIKNLLDRQWIKVAGHRDLPGRPALFATTKQFLDDFNLKKLSDMPPLSEVENLEAVEQRMQQKLQQELDFNEAQVSLQDTLTVLKEEAAKEEDMQHNEIEDDSSTLTSSYDQPQNCEQLAEGLTTDELIAGIDGDVDNGKSNTDPVNQQTEDDDHPAKSELSHTDQEDSNQE